MLIVRPDFDRRIDLPGAGPCPRPVELDRTSVALNTLVSLRVYSFPQGAAIDGEAEEDEVFVVLMQGAADITIRAAGQAHGPSALRRHGGVAAVYLPPHASYRLEAVRDCDVAYARARPRGTPASPCGFRLDGDVVTAADHATAMAMSLGPDVPHVDAAAERFVHVRSATGGCVRLGDAAVGDWETAVLTGEDPPAKAFATNCTALTITAL